MPTSDSGPSGPSAADLDQARRDAGLSVIDLWIAYIGLGGSFGLTDVRRLLDSGEALPVSERRLLALALDERYVDLGRSRRLFPRDGSP